jgi:hypothetical protein
MTKPVDPRAALLRQMAELRQRIDPAVLKQGVEAMQAKTAAAAKAKAQQTPPAPAKSGEVPYDRENAAKAVQKFLENRQDGGAFLRKLTAALKRGGGNN